MSRLYIHSVNKIIYTVIFSIKQLVCTKHEFGTIFALYICMNTLPFTPEQQKFLEEIFTSAFQKGAFVREMKTSLDHDGVDRQAPASENNVYGTPVSDLCKEEIIKLEENPVDIWEKIVQHGESNQYPKGGDIFRFKYHGLFHVAPAQKDMMLRIRVPGCQLNATQMRALAEIADRWGAGYADITTRGNFQFREIAPKNIIPVLLKLFEAGLTSRGAGADNVRNITASPTSGFDAFEIIDVLPFAKSLHHYILNNRKMYELPRKFNVCFDNGGIISVAADTNDISFVPVEINDAIDPQYDKDITPGIYFRILLAGITGHGRFAQDAGILVRPQETVAVAIAMIRVFIENGSRTNRKKARLAHLIDKWGVSRFLEETEKKLPFPLQRVLSQNTAIKNQKVRHSHVGVYKQKQPGLNYVGVAIPIGRLKAKQMFHLADIAERHGSGDLRITIWQNIIIPDIPNKKIARVKSEIKASGFTTETNFVTGGIISCTGKSGCNFAAADTKKSALTTAAWLEGRVSLDRPVSIHFTGCPNSCAQHFIGDIGVMAVPVDENNDEGNREGYNLVLGGGCDNDQGLAREVFWKVSAEKLPLILETILSTYSAKRETGESFSKFIRRHEVKALQEIFKRDSL